MQKFELKGVKGRLLAPHIARTVTEAAGKKGAVKKLFQIEALFEIGGEEGDVEKVMHSLVNGIWKGMTDVVGILSGEEDEERGGFDVTARKKLPELSVTFAGDADAEEIIIRGPATCRSKPKLKVEQDGTMTFVVKLAVKVDRATLIKVATFCGGDVYAWMEPAQMDMSEVVDIKGKRKKRMSLV